MIFTEEYNVQNTNPYTNHNSLITLRRLLLECYSFMETTLLNVIECNVQDGSEYIKAMYCYNVMLHITTELCIDSLN